MAETCLRLANLMMWWGTRVGLPVSSVLILVFTYFLLFIKSPLLYQLPAWWGTGTAMAVIYLGGWFGWTGFRALQQYKAERAARKG